MRKAILYFFLFLLLLVAPLAIRYVQYYRLFDAPERTAVPTYDPANVAAVPTPPANAFTDTPQSGRGIVLVDKTHNNQFNLEEIVYLDSRLAARGYELLPHIGDSLESALRSANAFVVIAPLTEFSTQEVLAVTNFVRRGGRLLLVGDPTRFEIDVVEDELNGPTLSLESNDLPLNSLANAFGITFNGDYLYNNVENEGNFRNIILKEAGFRPTGIMDDLSQLVFYGAQSVQVGPGGTAVITADDDTWSSATDRPGDLVLAALGASDRVLALGDIHFLTDPYFTVYDNSAFVARIADFLTDTSERALALRDFPFFLRTPVNLVYTGAPNLGPDAFDEIIALQTTLRAVDTQLRLAAAPDEESDTLYVGLYNQADEVTEIPERAEIMLQIDPPLAEEEDEVADTDSGTPTPQPDALRLVNAPLGSVQMSGTALILLEEQNGRRNMVVLAASSEGLENTLQRLIDLVPQDSSATADCVLQDNVALCPTYITNEPVEAVLETSDTPDIEPTEETAVDEETDEDTDATTPLDATPKGDIQLGDTIEETLEAAGADAWSFDEGPNFVDIIVEPAEALDVALEVYDPDNELIATADSGFAGESETLRSLEIPTSATYTIIVRDFGNNGGAYALSVSLGEEPQPTTIENIFIFADDDGQPLEADGVTSAAEFADLLDDDYDVTVWIASEDGPLQEGALDDADLLIWDSGNYQEADSFQDEDTLIILNFLEAGGNLFIIGSSPTLFGTLELAPLTDVEVTGSDPILLEGLEPDSIVNLDQTYATALFEEVPEPTPNEIPFLVRGPESEASGSVVGLAAIETSTNQQKSVLLLLPFSSLPEEFRAPLLENLLTWYATD